MNVEEKYLIKILNDYIHNNPVKIIPRNISLEILYQISKKHNITAIVYEILAEAFQNKTLEELDIIKRFQTDMISTIFISELQRECVKEIVRKFENNGITYVLLKGYQLKELYPNPDLRTMGDIDILISPENRDVVHEIFLSEGYQKDYGEGAVWTYRYNNVIFEIHTSLVFETIQNGINYDTYFKNATHCLIKKDDTYRRYIKPEIEFIYLMFHLAKHMCTFGAGIRMIMDIALYIMKHEKKLNWTFIQTELKNLKLMKFTSYIVNLIKEIFQISTVFPVKKCDRELLFEMQEYILTGGIFGFNRPYSISYLRRGISTQNINNKLLIKCRAYLKLIFPTRKYMTFFLPQVEKHIMLLPVAWVIRWKRTFNNRKYVKDRLEGMNNNTEEARKQYYLLKKIGLY